MGFTFWIITLGMFISQATRVRADTCYDELGCFNNSSPWSDPLRPVPPPLSPKEVDTRFMFFETGTKKYINVTTWPNISFNGVPFNASMDTVFITHGFGAKVLDSWPASMAQAFASKGSFNVFAVDWSKGAASPNYLIATSNTRIVGAEMARFINYTIKTYSVNRTDIHLIGHSLGAHVCAYASNGVGGVYQIIGLDSAQPLFEGQSSAVYLSKKDACLVQAIHTDAAPFIPFLGLGFVQPYGDKDHYVNNGFSQPGCTYNEVAPKNMSDLSILTILGTSLDVLACPHSRAPLYFLEAVANASCIFWGHRLFDVSNMLNFPANGTREEIAAQTGNATLEVSRNPCDLDSCSPMAMNASGYPAHGLFISRTHSKEPFCYFQPKSNANMASEVTKYLRTERKTRREICAAKGIKVD